MIKENLIELYEKCFKDNWERPALTDYFKKKTLSYGELSESIVKLHILFENLGVKKGDKIALIGRATPNWGTVFMATISYGAVIVPILQDFNENDIQHIVNHSDSVLLFAGEQYYEKLDKDNMSALHSALCIDNFKPYFIIEKYTRSASYTHVDEVYAERYPKGLSAETLKFKHIPNSELMLLNYTSGTTGFSKGVMLTGNNIAGNMLFGISLNVHYPGSRALAFLPLAHAYGCAFDFLYPLIVGAHVTMLGKIPAPKLLIAAMHEVKPSVIFTVPLIIEKIYKKQIQPMLEKQLTKFALKVPLLDNGIYSVIRKKLSESFGGEFTQIIIGGAAINNEVEEFLRKIKLPFCIGYGMTECAPLISYEHPDKFIPKSCGKILPDIMEVKIDNREPLSGVGEICVRGENVMMGYYKNEEATRAVLDDEGWLHTGDMGSTADDGTIFIRGRSKTMILRSNGQNIYPEEIESKLNNMPCVMESLVVERDNKLVALVYPDYESLDAIGSRGEQMMLSVMKANIEELNTQVAAYEKISDVVLYPEEFEKTPKRSIKRYLYTT